MRDRRTCSLIPVLSSPSLPHFALASFASAYCSDDLAVVCTISHKEASVNIYVGNLAFTSTDHDLRQLFEPYGAAAETRVITNRDTAGCQGFGPAALPGS